MPETGQQPNRSALNIGGVLGGIASLGSTAINAWTQNRNTDKTNQSNRELAEYAYSKDLEMWNKTNEYNLPSSQMARLKEAGLNPNLIYGSGGATTQAAQMPKYNAPTMNYNYKPAVDPLQALGAFQNIALQNAQLDNMKAQRDNVEADTAIKLSEGLYKDVWAKAWTKNRWTDSLQQGKVKPGEIAPLEWVSTKSTWLTDYIEAQMKKMTIGAQVAGDIQPYQADAYRTNLNLKNRQVEQTGLSNIMKRQDIKFYEGTWLGKYILPLLRAFK